MQATRALRLVTVGVAASLLLASCAVNERGDADPDGEGLSGTISATGASSQTAAQEAWQAGFQTANTRVTVNYEPTGSGTGRANFRGGANSFVGSDRAFTDAELAAGGFQACVTDAIVEVPLYISPVVVAFHLDGVESLDLSPRVIADIFAGRITRWNDPAIVSDNPTADLPDHAISPVHRSDPSGTQETFTRYLSLTEPEAWPYGATDSWPLTGGESAQGIAGVKQVLSAGRGTIGFLDASQAAGLGQARLEVAGEFVAFSPASAAMLVENSPLHQGRGPGDLVFDVDPAAAPAGSYPLALVSYLIGCEQYADAATADLVKGYFTYMASPEGQAAAAAHAGNAPISDGLREKILGAIDLIRVGTENAQA